MTCLEQHTICVDMGTTNTRVWLLCGDQIVASSKQAAGVRVSAREGSTGKVKSVLQEMILEVLESAGDVHQADSIAAAGMITSSLGLKEIPHVLAPAGLSELADAAQWHYFREISNLPFLLVPGVRTATDNNSTLDVMRGEETLCVGLVESDFIESHSVVLNLGSHWKAIEVDGRGRICSSVTSLSGELIDAARNQTVLASSLPHQFPQELGWKWVERGMSEARLTNLPQTLFRIRLLELDKEGSAEERLAFLVGALVATDLDALIARGVFRNKQIVLMGNRAIGECWRRALEQKSINSLLLSAEETDRAFLKGLQQVVTQAPTYNRRNS
ncbi:MAG TPA: 2-dehydro-3-deoxygalactonokinase [Pyrinomonadaceae bacterium]|nr:2-dehydro-3-deoxygalactonokinase [Pyrinomonadaceae bacterium]